MRKIILNLATTLDGFIEGPDGEIDWLVRDEEIDFGDILNEIVADKDAIFYGRVSYEKWGNYQPDDNASQKLKDAYRLMHSKTKYVFSSTKTSDGTEAVFVNGNIKNFVESFKQKPGKNIWLYGGSKLTTTFMNMDLIDEYRLAVHPVILGKGKALFQNIQEKHKLKLLSVQGHKSGVALMKYEADRQPTV